jgi:transposase InsO family protein
VGFALRRLGSFLPSFRRCYGREFCGRPDQHPYELFLQLEDIEHRTTRVKRPQSNGIVERFHRTLLDEHFRVEGRRTWFETIDEMQKVLDDYLVTYNTKRPHQGRGMNGRTPITVFKAGLPKPTQKQKENRRSAKAKSPPQKPETNLAA